MKKIIFFLMILATVISSCKLSNTNQQNQDNKELAALFDKYYEERLQLFPLEATAIGDERYNDKLYADFTDGYRKKEKEFYNRYLVYVTKFDRDQLNDNDKISYDIFKREMEISLEGLKFHTNLIPANQFWGMTLDFGQLGSGEGNQPFKTEKNYDDWLKRMDAFSVWTDSAIQYFKKGIETNYVLPKSLVQKMIPQMDAMVVSDVTKSLFYGPINKLPNGFSDADKKRLTEAFTQSIQKNIIFSYKKLGDFLKNEYLPKARNTSGISALPDGAALYNYEIAYWTTTNKTADEIYNTGLSEVKRIRGLMDSVKNAVGFKGDLKSFFEFMKTDKQFMPYKKPEDVLNAFHAIYLKMEPNLKKMYGRVPKSKFEIRQTEAFRAASASAEYNIGSPDGSRPGIFYVPILDATKFNTTSGMESLFLHEAIPGHHYQSSLQMENEKLPKFRRFLWYGAYGEGYALYCESLGKELGLYTDPYQYMGALGDEMHRAIRLVVDVAIHTKNMTREEAIKYMMDNEAISEDGATAEIERYMAIPGQALSYKIGALKIRELRNKYQQELGDNFKLSDFHDEFLKDGCMPLEIVEKKMDDWAAKQKK
ncbi:hypothetical protein GALL_128220 [mine drainage metagenome]|uniref:DUF885 domain-containing protein n=1 Tax=mine drainage metagenome TaxID=410659 RepID=A0A1J5SYA9_9ZZZZ